MSFARLMANLVDANGDVPLAQLDNVTILDSADVVSAAPTSSAMTVYSTLDSLPTSSLTAGDQAFVSANKRLYISNGSGWYNVALINLSPTMSLDQSGTIALTAESLTATVTITAQDSDNPAAILSYSVESDGNMLATGVTVSQDSSVFTITSLTEDSGGVAGAFDLTFKVSDQINQASESLSFTLTFSNVIDSSAETVLLVKATGNSVDNETLTYQDANDASANIVPTNDVYANTFTPYRSGGYSYYFDGSSYIQFAASNDWGFGYNPWAVEFWYKGTDATGDVVSAFNQSSPFAGFSVSIQSGLIKVFLSDGVGSDGYDTVSGTTTVNDGEWHHVAVTSDDGNVVRCHIDGVRVDGGGARGISFTEGPSTTGQVLRVGADTNASPGRILTGYLRDVHVTGSELYPQANFTPPTEPITVTADTVLLTCQDAYMKENSSSNRTVTISGDMSTMPIGPYDYEPWVADDHVGSVYFDADTGSSDGDYHYIDLGANGGPDGDFTIEFWGRHYDTSTNSGYFHMSASSGFSSSTNAFAIGKLGDFRTYTGAGAVVHTDGSQNLASNKWCHIAVVRSGSTITTYFNGNPSSITGTDGNDYSSYRYIVLGGYYSTGFLIHGHIADFRYVKGTAVYTSSFTPPTSPLTHITNTKALMNNKSNANVYDKSASWTLGTVNGMVTSNSVRKFATSSSIQMVNSGYGMEILPPDRTFWQNFLSNPFTIEGWFYFNNTGQNLLVQIGAEGGNWSSTNGQVFLLYSPNTTVIRLQWNSSASAPYADTAYGANAAWHHVAVSYDKTTMRAYIDGTRWVNDTTAFTPTYVTGGTWTVRLGGYTPTIGYGVDGYIQDWKFTNRCKYTAASITVPTAEFEL